MKKFFEKVFGITKKFDNLNTNVKPTELRQPCIYCGGQGSHKSSISGRHIKCPRCNKTGLQPK
jgi:hypothetical protein